MFSDVDMVEDLADDQSPRDGTEDICENDHEDCFHECFLLLNICEFYTI